jgi:glycosyltransferase involved in cell wall biosynthesis
VTPSLGRRISHVGIVVPAHNEEVLLPACISALETAAAAIDVFVEILVVLDACTDLSSTAARGVSTITVQARKVGVARHAGFTHLLDRRPHGVSADSMWLATTDADSAVPRHWLTAQLDHAAAGAEIVAGTVQVSDWHDWPATISHAYTHQYALARRPDGHGHVHGANLAMAADVYLALGGFGDLAADEDVTLVDRAVRSGRAITWAEDLPVATSARMIARAPAGFAGHLSRLNPAAQAGARAPSFSRGSKVFSRPELGRC